MKEKEEVMRREAQYLYLRSSLTLAPLLAEIFWVCTQGKQIRIGKEDSRTDHSGEQPIYTKCTSCSSNTIYASNLKASTAFMLAIEYGISPASIGYSFIWVTGKTAFGEIARL